MSLTTNLISYYELSNGAYSTDSAGSNTLTTTGSTQQSAGFIGYGGSGDNIQIASNMGITGTHDISLSWWVKFINDISADGTGLMFSDTTLTTDRLIGLDYDYNGGTRRLNLYNSDNSITASYTTTLGTSWHHIVVVRASTAITLYLDNVAVISGAAQGTATGGQDASYLGTGKQFGGSSDEYYDEWGVWNRALSAGEVSQLYNGGAGLQYPFTVPHTRSTSGGAAYSSPMCY